MKLIPTKTPGFVKSMFPSFIWNVNTVEKELYLTFDDGPTPEITPWVLSVLKSYDAKATFFCIGSNIMSSPEVFQEIIDHGHAIGNHTFQHLKGWKHQTKRYLKDVETTDNLIHSYQLNEHSKLFRPPYGKLKKKQAAKIQDLGYNIIMWDVLSFDWDKQISKTECLNNVITAAKAGSIIVFHDSFKAHKNLEYTLPRVLEHFSKRGFKFKALD